jgi:endo-1,4-beta-xylanase
MLTLRGVLAVAAGLATGGDTRTICQNATGLHRGRFHTFWHDTGAGCMELRGGGYRVQWQLGERGNLPPGANATLLGTVISDGGTYRVYRTRRIEQPSIEGTATFHQYWSVRTSKRVIGTGNAITFRNHVAGWRRLGLHLGTLDYQVLATEGFGSKGRSDIDVNHP